MRVQYDAEADVLLVEVRGEDPIEAVEEPGGVIISCGEDGEPVSVEFLNASKRGMVGPDGVSVQLQSDQAPA